MQQEVAFWRTFPLGNNRDFIISFLMPESTNVGIAETIIIPRYIDIVNGAVPITLLKNGTRVTKIEVVAAKPTANVNLELLNGLRSNSVLALLAS